MIKRDFKVIRLSVTYLLEATKENYLLGSFIEDLFSVHNDIYNTEKEMNIHLQNLYGSTAAIVNLFSGKIALIFSVSIPSPRLVNDKNLFNEGIKLLDQLISSHQEINPKIFNNLKRMMIEEVRSQRNDKRRYAYTKFYEYIHDGLIYPTNEEIIKFLRNLEINDIKLFHQEKVLKSEHFTYLNGPFTENELIEFNKTFTSTIISPVKPYLFIKMHEYKKLTEYFDNAQSQVIMGYFLKNNTPRERITALLLNLIIGGKTESRLFKKIREELNLCYDISSVYNSTTGLLTVGAGIAPKNTEFASIKIKDEISRVISLGITEEELTEAKDNYTINLFQSLDSQTTYLLNEVRLKLNNIDYSFEVLRDTMNSITVEEVNKLAKELELILEYHFVGKE